VRRREAERAEQIVADEAEGWDRWAEAEQATPTIVALRARLRAIVFAELERSLQGRLKHLGSEDRAALERMLEAALNKLLHGPTVRLRQAAAERSLEGAALDQLAAALEELFSLDDPNAPVVLEAADEPSAELEASQGSRAFGTSRR
jgi:glutamyl-tRNA reductase